MVKNLPASAADVRDPSSIPGLGRSPGGGKAAHFSILDWKIPWTEEPGGLQSLGHKSWTACIAMSERLTEAQGCKVNINRVVGLNCVSSKRHVEVLTLVPVNVSLFENRMVADEFS